MTDQSPATSVAKAEISYEQFSQLDLRVATITTAEVHPNADRLLRIQLDDGTEAGRQVCAGIKPWYQPEDLLGKQVIIVANLQPKKIRGEISEGMILAASSDAGAEDRAGEVVLLTLDRPVRPGSSVS